MEAFGGFLWLFGASSASREFRTSGFKVLGCVGANVEVLCLESWRKTNLQNSAGFKVFDLRALGFYLKETGPKETPNPKP